MLSIKVLVFVAAISSPSWAETPYENVKLNIFGEHPSNFESNVYKSLQMTKDFFVRQSKESKTGNLVPYMNELAKLAAIIRTTLTKESDWHKAFTQAAGHEPTYETAASQANWMEIIMLANEEKIKTINKEHPDQNDLVSFASVVHKDLNTMMNYLDQDQSLFKKYPLVGTPVLIQLALFSAAFSPFEKALIPDKPKISCKVYDVLMNYRARMVDVRLEKLNAPPIISIYEQLFQVMSLPYNQNGYNQTNPAVIDCDKGCKRPGWSYTQLCLKDAFGSDEYYVPNYSRSKCVVDYAALTRYRVEQLLPIELLNKFCDTRQPKTPTGSGWLTIKLKKVTAFGKPNGSTCKWNIDRPCDPFVKLFINGQQMLQTPTKKSTCCYKLSDTFTTEKIPKESKIKIELWDDNIGFWSLFQKKHLLFSTEGTIDNFLKNPIRKGAVVFHYRNTIETISFWQDELK